MAVDFGIRLPLFAPDRSEHALAYYDRTLNSLSEHITTVWPADHLQKGDSPSLEAWVLIAYLAGAYPRFKYGHLVNCQSYRNPALLAYYAIVVGAWLWIQVAVECKSPAEKCE